MTTEELIERLNKNDEVHAESKKSKIFICDCFKRILFAFNDKATNFLDFSYSSLLSSDSMYKASREYVAAQIEEYLQTPIEERNPKKKYVLAWCGDDNGKSNYFVKHNGSWFLVPQKGDEFPEEALFTQKELDQIGERCFYMKPVIEALKVEV